MEAGEFSILVGAEVNVGGGLAMGLLAPDDSCWARREGTVGTGEAAEACGIGGGAIMP